MKQFIFLFSFFLLSTTVYCQLDKNYWLVGGTGSLFAYNSDFTTVGQPTNSAKLTEINLSANVGYFFFDKFVAGIRPGFYSIRSRTPYSQGGGITHGTILYAGPFARYYFLDKDKQFNLLIDASYQIGSNVQFEHKGIIKNASMMAGTEVFFNTSTGIELLLGYQYQKRSIDNDPQASFIAVEKGLYVSIGFQIHLTDNQN